jgi:hypothetical protein
MKSVKSRRPRNLTKEQILFWSLRKSVRKSNGCLEWTGTKQGKRDYGVIKVGGGYYIGIHRFVYEMCHGPIPEGLVVRHKCDNPSCIAIGHLEVGTNKDNSSDMVLRDRQAKGEANGFSKLTESKVLEIRKLSDQGVSRKGLASLFDISLPQVDNIRKRRQWRHI